MIKPAPPQPRGIAGLVFLFCGVALIVGLGFDLALGPSERFSVVSLPGGRAVLGVGVAAAIVLVAHGMRFALGRRPRVMAPGERSAVDAVDHS